MLFCGTKKHQNASRNAKTTPRFLPKGPKRPQVHFQKAPKATKNRSQTARRKKGRTKTIPRPFCTPQGVGQHSSPPPWGAILASKTASKSTLKRSKIEAKNQVEKKAIQDDLGPILERSWVVLGRPLGRKNIPNPYKTYCFVNNHFFEDKTVRRGFWDQLGSTKGPNEPNMGPKKEPKTTQDDQKPTSKSIKQMMRKPRGHDHCWA